MAKGKGIKMKYIENYLPFTGILIILALLMAIVVVGIVWFILTRQNQGRPSKIKRIWCSFKKMFCLLPEEDEEEPKNV
ncbi:MAG: hypothetical protein HY973_03365 [Candidatus Kerfeldbacteria bacterium]|nr:hypothetical protein [Candidatus Kerfeldbacteria bacterium]